MFRINPHYVSDMFTLRCRQTWLEKIPASFDDFPMNSRLIVDFPKIFQGFFAAKKGLHLQLMFP